jgi:outer membrane protein TolC
VGAAAQTGSVAPCEDYVQFVLGGSGSSAGAFQGEREMKQKRMGCLPLVLAFVLATGPAAQGQNIPQTSAQNPVLGSVPSGKATPEVLALTLSGAIDRALRQNLGVLFGGDAVLAAQGESWQERSRLLPNLSARVAETAAQVNLAAQGFQKVASRFPGGGFPLVIGPFGYFDMRAYLSQSIVDMNALHDQRAVQQSLSAEQNSYRNARETVALVVGAIYIETLTASARVQTAEAQVQTAQALQQQAVDLRKNGVSAGIDVLRAEVELQTRRQELIAARNALAKQNLSLARAIGLPLDQAFRLADAVPYEPVTAPGVEEALKLALASRADFQSAQARVNTAEERRSAATAERMPSLTASADYGLIGPRPGETHGTFSATAALRIPIFAGNKAHGDALVAQAELDRSRQRLEDLRAQIEQDVRIASLDLQAAGEQVAVARSNADLAQQTLVQSRDRFGAGITGNIEIVQAQEAVAHANESTITSLHDYNLARMQLARATGSAEKEIRQYGKEQ